MIPISARIFVIFDYSGEYHCVIPKEIKDLYKSIIAKENLLEKRDKARHLSKYAIAAVNLYGLIKIYDFTEIFNKYTDSGMDCKNMDETLAALGLGGTNYGILDDYLIHGSLFNSEEVRRHVEYPAGLKNNKPYYIPSNEEFLKYADANYYEETAEVSVFKECLKKHGLKNQDDLEGTFIEMNWSIKNGLDKPLDFIRILNEAGFRFKSQAAAKKSMDAAMSMYSSTRMWVNNGHTPNETVKFKK